MNLFGNTFDAAPELEKIEEMDKNQLLAFEKEATGLYLSGHPTDAYAGFIARGNFTPIGDLASHRLPDGKRVTVVGALSDFKVRQLKNKNIMATATIEDVSGVVGVTVFGDTYARFRPLLMGGAVVLLTGKVSEREDRDTELVCERVEAVPETAGNVTVPEKRVPAGLYLRVDSITDPKMDAVRDVLARYPGTSPVILACKDTGKRMKARGGVDETRAQQCTNELSAVLGTDNVKFVL